MIKGLAVCGTLLQQVERFEIGKELKSRENRQKRLKSVGSIPGYLRDIAYKFAGETWKHLS